MKVDLLVSGQPVLLEWTGEESLNSYSDDPSRVLISRRASEEFFRYSLRDHGGCIWIKGSSIDAFRVS